MSLWNGLLTPLIFILQFHGRLFGSLSATRSKAIHKLDVPAFDWPVCPWPGGLFEQIARKRSC